MDDHEYFDDEHEENGLVGVIHYLLGINDEMAFQLMKKHHKDFEPEDWTQIFHPCKFSTVEKFEKFIDRMYKTFKNLPAPEWYDEDDEYDWFTDQASNIIFECHLKIEYYDCLLKRIKRDTWLKYLENGPTYPLILFMTKKELRAFEKEKNINRFELAPNIDAITRILDKKPPQKIIDEAIFLPNIIADPSKFKLLLESGAELDEQVVLASIIAECVPLCFEHKDFGRLDHDFIIKIYSMINGGDNEFEIPKVMQNQIRCKLRKLKKSRLFKYSILRCYFEMLFCDE